MPTASVQSASVIDLKRGLRAAMTARRDALDPAARAEMDAARASLILALPQLAATPGVVAGYWPMRSEADPRPIMAALAAQGRALALPAVVDGRLAFRAWRPGDALAPGGFGTSVPAPSHAETQPTILLVPLLAFDGRCFRLGYGKGHYDRAIAALGPALTIGVAFEAQRVERVPIEGHDAALDLVATERYVHAHARA
jgi:5-formyltetrahydrofolate cyclo-ligase